MIERSLILNNNETYPSLVVERLTQQILSNQIPFLPSIKLLLLELDITKSNYTATSFYYYYTARRSFKLTYIKMALQKPLIRNTIILSSEGRSSPLNGQRRSTLYPSPRYLLINLTLIDILSNLKPVFIYKVTYNNLVKRIHMQQPLQQKYSEP